MLCVNHSKNKTTTTKALFFPVIHLLPIDTYYSTKKKQGITMLMYTHWRNWSICHNWKSTGVTNSIINVSVVFKRPMKSWQCDKDALHQDRETEAANCHHSFYYLHMHFSNHNMSKGLLFALHRSWQAFKSVEVVFATSCNIIFFLKAWRHWNLLFHCVQTPPVKMWHKPTKF